MTGAAPQMDRLRAAVRNGTSPPLSQRLEFVSNLRGLIAADAETLARASADARQRPLAESLAAEVMPLADACRFLEKQAPALLAPRHHGRRGRPLWLGGVRSEVRREPLGVILIIGPGNYPLLLPGVQLVQALIAGNAVMLKPGTGGTASAAALVSLVHQAGFDPALVQLLSESTESATAAIDAGPDKVVFTGSAAVAEKILARLAPRLIPAVIEASGCDAVIVRADADPDLTATALAFALTINGGATCMAPKRIFLHQEIAADVKRRLVAAFRKLPPAAAPISPQHRGRIDRALADGAATLHEQPLLLENVPPDSPLWHDDVFGPFALIETFTTDDEAVTRANDCPFALGAGIFTRDPAAADSLAGRLRVGLVTINDLIVSSADPRLPFGGRGRSGFGVTRGAEGLLEMTAVKTVTVSRGKFRPAYQALGPKSVPWLLGCLRLVHGRGWIRRFRRLPKPT